jgi:hypothetical protein
LLTGVTIDHERAYAARAPSTCLAGMILGVSRPQPHGAVSSENPAISSFGDPTCKPA